MERRGDLLVFNFMQTPGRVQDAMRNDLQLMIRKSAVPECLFTVIRENNDAVSRPHEMRSQSPFIMNSGNEAVISEARESSTKTHENRIGHHVGVHDLRLLPSNEGPELR